MFGNKKKQQAPEAPKRKGAALANQMGIGEIENMMYGDVDNDEDLEAELMALQGENPVKRKPKQPAKPLTMADLDKYSKMAEMDVDDDDEDMSDTDDPDLLAELEDLSTEDPTPSSNNQSTGGSEDQVIVLVERMSMYEAGIETAKSVGDTSKQKRYDRGLKTIQDLLKKVQQGKAIDENDIPPKIAVNEPTKQRMEAVVKTESKSVPTPPKQPALETDDKPATSSSHDEETEKMLEARRNQYKAAALNAKHAGDINTAKRYVQIAKQFDSVLSALKSGQPIDLSKMPPPPPLPGSSKQAPLLVQSSSRTEQAVSQGAEEEDETPAPSAEESRKVFKAPEPPKTVLEALEQRFEKYKSAETEAKAAGEGSKARRHGRIVKQYQDAIKAHKAGRAVDLEELPCPPGYAPFPTQSSPVKTAPAAAPSAESNQKSPAPAGMRAAKPAAAPEQTTQQHTTPQQSPSNASQKARPCE